MRGTIFFFLMLVAVVSLSGCNTLKGAAEGFTKDVSTAWNQTSKADAWLQQKAW